MQLSQAWSEALPGISCSGVGILPPADKNVLPDAPGVLFERLAFAVEPKHEDVAVARQQLLDLSAFIVDETFLERTEQLGTRKIRFVEMGKPMAGFKLVAKIARRIIDPDQDPFFAKGVGQQTQDVLAKRSFRDPEIAVGRVEHAEAVMVLGCKNDVFDARQLGQSGPFGGLEIDGIEGLGQGVIFPDIIV